MAERISRGRLEEIITTLDDRDKSILNTVRECRYISTGQISRLHFTDSTTAAAALKAATRNMNKLKNLSLIYSLERRIGGARSGSGSLVWRLEAAGERILRITDGAVFPHRKRFEPSPHFLAHTLAVSECFVRMTEICRHREMKLAEMQTEPGCWRSYGGGGRLVTLKPDLFAVTICDDYEDRWFLELDLDTESPIRIIEKCRKYFQYYRSGLEQKQYGIFPLVVWIVPDSGRKESVAEHIKFEFSKLPKIFTVITPDELGSLIRMGAEGGSLC